MWFKISLLILTVFVFVSCGDSGLKRDFDEAEKLAIEAATSRDSLQLAVDSLKTRISLYEKNYISLYKTVQTLKSDTTFLNLQLREVKRKFVQNKQKPKASIFVEVANLLKKEDVAVSHSDTSTTVVVADSGDDTDTKNSSKVRSFIEYIWGKRNKVEP